jgi:hypothetical protein
MSLDISPLPLAQQNQVKAFATQMEAAMDRARNEVASNRAGTQLKRWFGAADDQTKIEIRDKMSKLRSYMKNYKVQVKIDRNRPTNENALATHLTGGIVGDGAMNSLQRLDAAKAGLSGNVGTVDLSENLDRPGHAEAN